MNIKHQIVSLAMGLSALSQVACNQSPQKEAADEQKAAQDKIANAEKEAAEKAAKAQREADEKKAEARKDLDEKKAEVRKDLAEELADLKYQAYTGLNDYKLLVSNRLAEQEKKLADLKAKGESKAATTSAEVKKDWNAAVATSEAELKQTKLEMKNLESATEANWVTVKGKVDASLKSFAKSVDNLGQKVEKL